MIAKACLRQGSFAPRKSRHVDHRGEIRQRRKRDCDWGGGVSASQAILDRAYGKAPILNTSDPTVMKRAIDMTDDELAAIASRATLHVVK